MGEGGGGKRDTEGAREHSFQPPPPISSCVLPILDIYVPVPTTSSPRPVQAVVLQMWTSYGATLPPSWHQRRPRSAANWTS